MEEKGNGFRFAPLVRENAQIAKTITTKAGSRMSDNVIIDIESNQEKFEFSSKNKRLFGINNNDFRIRKLTPRECFRLMGMRDDDIDKIQQAGISNTQQYKMAGNSIVVDVLEAIFKNLFMEG